LSFIGYSKSSSEEEDIVSKTRNILARLVGLSMAGALLIGVTGSAMAVNVPVDGSIPSYVSQYSQGDEAVLGEVIVGLSGSTDMGQVNALAAAVGGDVAASIKELNLHLIRIQGVNNMARKTDSAVGTLAAQSGVLFAEPNYIGHIDDPVMSSAEPRPLNFVPNDPRRPKQWQLVGAKQNLYNAWNLSKGSSTKKIAIIDTGVDMDHPDIGTKLLKTQDWDFVNWDSNPQDDHNHGSHVAGIAAAKLNNGVGIAGIAGLNKVLAVKVCNSGGSCKIWDTAMGISHAVIQGVKVMNISLGWKSPSMALKSAVDFAWNTGVLVVASSGNDGTYIANFPASFPSTISVASTGKTDVIASYSTRHSTVNVSASGGSGSPTTSNIYSLNRSGGYMWMAGTSMAAPQVTGALGLYVSRYPATTAIEARGCLHLGVDDKGSASWDSTYGWGRLDVYKLLRCRSLGKRVLIDNTHANINYTASSFKWSALRAFWEDLAAKGYRVYFSSDVGFSGFNKYDIVILLDPHSAYSTTERNGIRNWVKNGNGNRLIVACEYGSFNDNSEANAMLSTLGVGIRCANATINDPVNYDQQTSWPIITSYKRNHRSTSTVWRSGLYAATYLTFLKGFPGSAIAWTSSSATAGLAEVKAGTVASDGALGSETVLETTDLNVTGPLPVAAVARHGVNEKGFVVVIGDSNIWSHEGCISTFESCSMRSPDNLHWFDIVMGWR
jgi:thermitase